MDVLRHALIVVLFTAFSFVSPVSADAPEDKKEVKKSASAQTPLELAEKDLAAAKKELEEYEKAVQHYFRGCANDLMDMAEDLKGARLRLAELEKNKGDQGEIKAVKEKVSGYERYFHEMEQERLTNPLSKHDITQVMNGLRSKVADLLDVRDRLRAEAAKVPAKKEN